MRRTVVLVILAIPWCVRGAGARGQGRAEPSFDSLAKQAETARDASRFDVALTLYRRALQLRPAWEEGLWNLGSIAYDLDRYAECAPAFRKLASVKPDSAPAWTMAGLCEYRLRRYDAALESLGRVEHLGFQEAPELAHAARLHLALVLTRAGRFEKAITLLTELTRGDGKSPEIVAAAGIAGLRRPLLPFEVPEPDRDLVLKLGDAMASAMAREEREAEEKFQAALAAYPSEPNLHFRYGAFLNAQDPDRGIEEIRRTLTLAPGHVLALVSLSTISLKREDTQAALDYGERAVKASPGDFSTHIALGRALLETDQNARAAGEFETAVRLAPASPEAHFNLASAYARLGRKADAAREQDAFRKLQQPAAEAVPGAKRETRR